MSDPKGDLRHLFGVQEEILILGGLLTEGDRALEAVRHLTPDDFTLQAHRTIFRTVLELDGKIGVGLSSIALRLDETGQPVR